MFTRLFGETEEEQLQYLQTRTIITFVSLIIPPVFAIVVLFMWGWAAVKSLFGVASVGAIFSGNFVIGTAIFLLYIILSYIIGLFCAFLGVGRFIYLKIKFIKKNKVMNEIENNDKE